MVRGLDGVVGTVFGLGWLVALWALAVLPLTATLGAAISVCIDLQTGWTQQLPADLCKALVGGLSSCVLVALACRALIAGLAVSLR